MKKFVVRDEFNISIIVPMYNAEKWIGHTLNSLLNQDYGSFEIIVVNDGSTDRSREILDQFSFDRRIRFVDKENGGTGSALNVGHKLARGKFVTWCSADNVYYPNFLSTLGSALVELADKGIGLVYGDFNFIDEAGKPIRTVTHEKPQDLAALTQGYDIGMAFMYTRELWNKVGEFVDGPCEDFNWCVRAAAVSEFALIKSNPLAGFRVHGDQVTFRKKQECDKAAQDCRKLAVELLRKRSSVQDDSARTDDVISKLVNNEG